MKRVLSASVFVMFFMTACSSVQHTTPETVPDKTLGQGDSVRKAAPQSKLLPTNSDVMYHVLSGEVLGGEGDFSGAAAEYLKAALASDDPSIAERAARIAVSANEWQMVELASDRWAMLVPESLDALELAAGSRLKEGDYAGAGYQMVRILTLSSADQARGWGIVSSLLASVKDRGRADQILQNLLTDFNAESNVDALYARSQLAARAGDLASATKLIDKALVLQSDRSDLFAWAGRLAVNRQHDVLALKHYKQAWDLSPDDLNLAMAYAELLKRNGDLAAAQAVLAGLPDTPDMRFARVVFALEAKDKGSAESLYMGFFNAPYANTPTGAFQAAQCAELLDHPRQAIDWYRKVSGENALKSVMRRAFLLAGLDEVQDARKLLALTREQADEKVRSQSYQAEAQILQEAGRKNEAMQLLNDALEGLPGDVSLHYARALLAVSLKQLALAESDLRGIIKQDPNNAAALNALGYTLADLTDRYPEAEQLIRKAYVLEPNDSSIIDSMGWIAYRLGRYPEAEKYMRKAWSKMRNAEIAAHLGEVLWMSGQQDGARSMWQLGVKIEQDNAVLNETMKRFGALP